MTRPRIAVIQAEWSTETKANLHQMERLVKGIHEEWGGSVKLLTFCEMAVTGFHPSKIHSAAEPIPGPATESLAKLARETGYYICNGSMLERDGDKVFNTTLIFDPNGDIVHKYRKSHPWSPPFGGEDVGFGTIYPVTEIPGLGKVGTMICMDGYIPEVARALAFNGAEIILWNTMTFHPVLQSSRAIAQARAIENQCYLVMGVGSGFHVGLGLHGHSMIVNPDGVITAEAGDAPTFLIDVIDPQASRLARNEGSHGLFSAFVYLRHFKHKYPQYADDFEKGAIFKDID